MSWQGRVLRRLLFLENLQQQLGVISVSGHLTVKKIKLYQAYHATFYRNGTLPRGETYIFCSLAFEVFDTNDERF